MKIKTLPALVAGFVLLALPAAADTLSALGRVLPKSGVVDVVGTPDATVEQILVQEGQWIEAGQPLAQLSTRSAALERVARAEQEVASAQAAAERDLELARTRLANAEAEARIAEERFARIHAARDSEFVSPDQLEERSLGRQNAQLAVLEARNGIATAQRTADQARRSAAAELAAARAELALAEVRAPIKARVLKTFARVGGSAARGPLFKLGDTSGIVVMTEVYEADVLKVKPGQPATISSAALPQKMTGRVVAVSSLVYRNALETLDPNQNAQSRIVEVTVQMDEAEPLDRLILLQVDVVIDI